MRVTGPPQDVFSYDREGPGSGDELPNRRFQESPTCSQYFSALV